jgi:hypothetical protein
VVGCLSILEWPATRIRDHLFGPPPDQAWLADRLDEAVEQLREELAAWWEVEAELVALWSSALQVQNMVLGDVDGSSSLAASMSVVAQRHEG